MNMVSVRLVSSFFFFFFFCHLHVDDYASLCTRPASFVISFNHVKVV